MRINLRRIIELNIKAETIKLSKKILENVLMTGWYSKVSQKKHRKQKS